MEVLVLSMVLFLAPRSTCQAAFAWHSATRKQDWYFLSMTVCTSSLGVACTGSHSENDVTIPLDGFTFGQCCEAGSWLRERYPFPGEKDSW